MKTEFDLVITDEDAAYASAQDRYACAFVRSVQRTLPEATRVSADMKSISFTIWDRDGVNGIRWELETTKEMISRIIKPIDSHEDITHLPLSKRTFHVDHAVSSTPVRRATEEEKRKRRARLSPAKRSGAASRRNRSNNPVVRSTGRWLDSDQALAEAGSDG